METASRRADFAIRDVSAASLVDYKLWATAR